MKTDHIVIVLAGVEGNAMRCENCTLQYLPPFPMPIEQYVEQAKGFALMHRRCVKPEKPSRQLELPSHRYAIDATIVERPEKPVHLTSKPAHDDEYESEDECSARTVREEMRAAGHKPAGPRDHGISATTDEPDPETDPPGPTASWARYAEDDPDAPEPDEPELTAIDLPSHYDKFVELYPFASTHGALRDVLYSVLTAEQYARLPNGTVEAWHPSSVVFQEIAHWARVELAHANSVGRGEHIAGLTLPAQLKMPAALEKAIAEPKKVRKPRAPKRSRLRAEP